MDFSTKNISNYDYRIVSDHSSSIDCFFKINGADTYQDDIKVYVGNNFVLDFLLQSLFWICLISLIPISKYNKFKNFNLSVILLLTILYVHFLGEENYYLFELKNFSNLLTTDNYSLLSIFVTSFLLLLISKDILEKRVANLLNYLPFVFLIQGTFNSLNFNFFLLVFSLFGLISLFEKKIPKFQLSFVFLVITIWSFNLPPNSYIFDVDKLKGSVSNAYSVTSIIFWSLIFFLTIWGVFYIIDKSVDSFSLTLLRRNFLVAGSLIVAIGYLSALNPIANYLSYYFLGLSKRPSSSLDSVGENAWRGLSPSAEGIGEYFGMVILISILLSIFEKVKLSKFEVILLTVNIYGLYEANNFTAALTVLFFLILIASFERFTARKSRVLISLFLIFAVVFGYIGFFNTHSFDEASNKLLKEATKVSLIQDLEINNFGKTSADELRYGELLNNDKARESVSNTYVFFAEIFNNNEITGLPNVTSIISMISIPLNRTEKWGTFIAKYNPSFKNLIFGYGPGQLANYYLGFNTKINSGLVLPHSSILSYQIFIGFFGILYTFFIVFKNLLANTNNHLYIILNIYLLVNLFKSDSILYSNWFLVFLFIINLYKLLIPDKTAQSQ